MFLIADIVFFRDKICSTVTILLKILIHTNEQKSVLLTVRLKHSQTLKLKDIFY